MTDQHAPPEVAPLADARKHIACAQAALAAAGTHKPALGPELSRINAELSDQLAALERGL